MYTRRHPRLIHPVPVVFEILDRSQSFFDTSAREAVRQAVRTGAQPNTGSRYIVKGHVMYYFAGGRLEFPIHDRRGVEKNTDGYVAFLIRDLIRAGLATKNAEATAGRVGGDAVPILPITAGSIVFTVTNDGVITSQTIAFGGEASVDEIITTLRAGLTNASAMVDSSGYVVVYTTTRGSGNSVVINDGASTTITVSNVFGSSTPTETAGTGSVVTEGEVSYILKRGDRIVRHGSRHVDLYVTSFEDFAHYPEMNQTMLQVDFQDRTPSAQKGDL